MENKIYYLTSSKNRILLFITTTVIFLFMSGVSLKFFIVPWLFVGIFFLVCFSLFFMSSTTTKIVFANLTAVIFALGAFEVYLLILSAGANDVSITPANVVGNTTSTAEYRRTHNILGYAPDKDNVIQDQKSYGAELIYDATYTINSDGLRISPSFRAVGADDCILFFGGSFTFGTGVNDDEAMPYRVGAKTNRRFQTYNFGFGGYGAHQMLAALEHGLVEDIIECRPKFLIYQAVPDHYRRVAGFALWDTHGPRYALVENKIKYLGPFDGESNLEDLFLNQLKKSYIFRLAIRKGVFYNKSSAELFVGIVDSAKDLAKQKFPNSEFHILLWPDQDTQRFELVTGELQSRGIRFHLVDDILGDAYADEYRISVHDRHPTASAHEKIAEYVVQEILPN